MNSQKRVYVDVHVIQTVPPSCVNRDDTGSPKTAVYGGIQRARVSSQSWKRAMRQMFYDCFDESELGVRTKDIVSLVAAEIKKLDATKDEAVATELAVKVLELTGIKLDKDKKTGKYAAKALFFMGAKQAENLAKLILNNQNATKKDAQEMLRKNQAVDIALFGRMVADDPSLNEDACAQVAHSISTHSVENEYDYFTAVDEMIAEDHAGAGMIGVVEYNSATLYRFATVAAHELYRALNKDEFITTKAIHEFVRSFVLSMPTGKQNTFANRTLPNAILVTVRKDQPINLAGAFEKPVPNNGKGFVEESVQRLKEYATAVCSSFAPSPVKSWEIGLSSSADKKHIDLDELLGEMDSMISCLITENK